MLNLKLDELIVLHRLIMEAKFSNNVRDKALIGSPLAGEVARKTLQEIIDLSKEVKHQSEDWIVWRQADESRKEWEYVKDQVENDAHWDRFSDDIKMQLVRDIISPLELTVEQQKILAKVK
jgi:hypothetical protein